jgi:hypothetical protein
MVKRMINIVLRLLALLFSGLVSAVIGFIIAPEFVFNGRAMQPLTR